MAEEHEIVAWIVKTIEQMIPKSYAASPPQQINVNRFDGGRGSGTTQSGESVDFITHPIQVVDPGNVVVGVPIGPRLFYIVGKRA